MNDIKDFILACALLVTAALLAISAYYIAKERVPVRSVETTDKWSSERETKDGRETETFKEIHKGDER